MNGKNIDHGKPFDWGKTSEDYGRFRDIYPQAFYDKILQLGLCTQGQRVLDLGTGTGVLPRNLYPHGASFTGVDISENQIAEAKRLSAGMAIDYLVSPAEDIRFPRETFDVVTACQCFIYFDKKVLLPKIYEILKPRGYFCILFMAWLPYESDIAKTSEDLVLKYNPHWTGGGMQRYDLGAPEWSEEWFEVDHALTFDLPVTFTPQSWHGRIKACRGIGASSLSGSVIAAWEKEHLAYVKTLPETFDILHYATVLNLRKRES